MNTIISISVFLFLFIIFIYLGFSGKNFRPGDLSKMHEWALGGQKLGTFLAWFLIGADLFTAYTFIAVPSGVFAAGSLFFFAVPYVAVAFAIAMVVMPKLFAVSKEKGYITGVDFVKDAFNSKTLTILIALTGVVAELPYIALQVIGMRAILTSMLMPFSSIKTISDITLIISFIILAAFTYTTGLRGITLTAVMKDIIIFATVIVIIIAVPLMHGGFHAAFKAKPVYSTLPPNFAAAYLSFFIMSAFALFLYPHAINGSLSSESAKKLRKTSALLPLYAIGLALIALFGILVYAVKPAMSILDKFPPSIRGAMVVPTLIQSTMPPWFTGFAFLGIFIGGLVPAAIMAMASANLLVRNVYKEFKPSLSPEAETKMAKWLAVVFKFVALGFVFAVPATFAISLQLLGGIIILQTLPAIFMGLYMKSLNKNALILGWVLGMITGIYFVEKVNNFGLIAKTLISTPFGLIFIGVIALAVNLAVVLIGSYIPKLFQSSIANN